MSSLIYSQWVRRTVLNEGFVGDTGRWRKRTLKLRPQPGDCLQLRQSAVHRSLAWLMHGGSPTHLLVKSAVLSECWKTAEPFGFEFFHCSSGGPLSVVYVTLIM